MKNLQALSEMENLFLALADKTRLRMLNLIREKEICVFLLTEILQESQPKISRHLAYLRNAGIVETRRQGKLVYYRIADFKSSYLLRILDETFSHLEKIPELRDEHVKLLEYYDEHNIEESTDETNEQNISAERDTFRRDELEIFLL